jgi:type I restriction enzyme S subunit
VSRHDGIISPAYVVLGLTDHLDPPFADFLFQSQVIVAQFVTASKGVGDIQRDVHMPWLKNTKIPVPDLETQRDVVRYLNHIEDRLQRYVARRRRLISLVNEQKQANARSATRGLLADYRSRLITEVVTGKLDVREAAAHLPEEIAYPTDVAEPLDDAIDDLTELADEEEALE